MRKKNDERSRRTIPRMRRTNKKTKTRGTMKIGLNIPNLKNIKEPCLRELLLTLPQTTMKPNLTQIQEITKDPLPTIFVRWRRLEERYNVHCTITVTPK
jgi:hypothetical protein